MKNEVNDSAKVEITLFFPRLNKLMRCKIYKQLDMPNTKHHSISIAKKLGSNLDCKLKFFFSTIVPTQRFVCYSFEKKKKFFIASNTHFGSRKKK